MSDDYLKTYWDEFLRHHTAMKKYVDNGADFLEALFYMGANAAMAPLIRACSEEDSGDLYEMFKSIDNEIRAFLKRHD